MAFSRMQKVKKEVVPPPPRALPAADDSDDDDMPPLVSEGPAAADRGEARMLEIRRTEEESRARAVAEAKRAYEEKKRREQAARKASAEEEARRKAKAADEARWKAPQDEAAQRRRAEATTTSAAVPAPVRSRGATISIGSTVRLQGLKAAPQLNGQRGVCKRLDSETGRWAVRLESGEEKSVKADNLVLEEGVANSRQATEAVRSAIEEERARQARMARSRDEVKRAGVKPLGSGFGAAGSFSSSRREPEKRFLWAKKSSPQTSPAYAFGQTFTGLGGVRSDGLPSHDDCEMAISAMISVSVQGMKEGLRQLGLPDYPLEFVPGKTLKLCGHNVREEINSMIHHWMEEEHEPFYKALRAVRKIVDDPIFTEDEMNMFPEAEGGWEQIPSKDGKKLFRKKRDPIDAPHLSQPERNDEGVQDTRNGVKQAWGAAAASSPSPVSKPMASRGAVISDPNSGGPVIEELPDDYDEPRAVPASAPAMQAPQQQQQSRSSPPRTEPGRPLPTHEPDEDSDEVEDLDEEEVPSRYAEDDYYALLGAEPTATLQELRTKFRTLVIAKHPEKGGDPAEFALLSKAYGVLSDSAQRQQYDERRAALASRRPAPAAQAPLQKAAPAAAKAAGAPRRKVFVD